MEVYYSLTNYFVVVLGCSRPRHSASTAHSHTREFVSKSQHKARRTFLYRASSVSTKNQRKIEKKLSINTNLTTFSRARIFTTDAKWRVTSPQTRLMALASLIFFPHFFKSFIDEIVDRDRKMCLTKKFGQIRHKEYDFSSSVIQKFNFREFKFWPLFWIRHNCPKISNRDLDGLKGVVCTKTHTHTRAIALFRIYFVKMDKKRFENRLCSDPRSIGTLAGRDGRSAISRIRSRRGAAVGEEILRIFVPFRSKYFEIEQFRWLFAADERVSSFRSQKLSSPLSIFLSPIRSSSRAEVAIRDAFFREFAMCDRNRGRGFCWQKICLDVC